MKTAYKGKKRLQWFRNSHNSWMFRNHAILWTSKNTEIVTKVFSIPFVASLYVVIAPVREGNDITDFYESHALKEIEGAGLVIDPMPADTVPWLYAVRNREGKYVGDIEDSYRRVQRGLEQFQTTSPDHNTCSVAWCHRKNCWYGWSHRAMFGFEEGFVFTEDTCGVETVGVGFTVRTPDDSYKAACAFADAVS